jgi:hypothetical protein
MGLVGHVAGLRRRWAAQRQMELPTLELEAFRRAGSTVYDVCLLAEERRSSLRAAGRHPWDAGPADASLLLAAWNARVHQSLAVELLESDAREDPRTAGYVPAGTYRQVWDLFAPVERWISVARRAHVSDSFWVGDEHELPVGLPLLHSRSAPAKHLRGLLTAADVLDRLLEQEFGAVTSAGPPPDRFAASRVRVDELAAQARASLHYAQGLWHPELSAELRAVIVGHLLPGMALAHHVGQFLCLPELVEQYQHRGRASSQRRGPQQCRP